MSNKTYKQQLIDLLTNEVKQESYKLKKEFCRECPYISIRYIGYCIDCKNAKLSTANKSRLQTYIKQVNALPASTITPRKFRHPVINSIYLFKPELINKLYGK